MNTTMNTCDTNENIIKEKRKRHPYKKYQVIAIVQARMNSTRLPGKVLMSLGGKPTIQHIVERLRRSEEIDCVVVATTDTWNDKKLVEFCANKLHCGVFMGSEEDVLDRTFQASRMTKKDNTIIVDITADCPLVDPVMVDMLVQCLISYNLDYCSNVMTRTWPDGFDIQVYKKSIYEKIHKRVSDKTHRCHTGWNIVNYSSLIFPPGLKMANVPAPAEYCFPEWGLTLDTREDYQVLDKIFSHFKGNDFSATDVMAYIFENKDVLDNKDIQRNIPGRG